MSVLDVACGDELLQTEAGEVVSKITVEVGLSVVVAVAVDYLVAELVLVVCEFLLDVLEPRVEFVFFRASGAVEMSVWHT